MKIMNVKENWFLKTGRKYAYRVFRNAIPKGEIYTIFVQSRAAFEAISFDEEVQTYFTEEEFEGITVNDINRTFARLVTRLKEA